MPATAARPEPTATPGAVQLWASPALPETLTAGLSDVTELDGRPATWTDERERSHVRLETRPDRQLSEWVYAAVTAFPNYVETADFEDLARAWAGVQERPRLLVDETERIRLEHLLGEPGDNVEFAPVEDIVELLWEDRSAIGLVPFHHLEPRLKVLSVDGQNPIDPTFDSEPYRLKIAFGVSGERPSAEELAGRLAWPVGNRDPSRLSTVAMTGVTALVRATADRMIHKGIDYPGLLIGDWLREANIAHISNEVSFDPSCPVPDPFTDSRRFCSDPEHIGLLEGLGVDVIELTGNHLRDHGQDPLIGTLQMYADRGWPTFGGGADLEAARTPAIVEHNGNRFAFFGCNAADPAGSVASESRAGPMPCRDPQLDTIVEALQQDGYIVIFTFQWPESDSPRPLPNQIETFRAIAESGAAIVNGSQAHRPQSMEFYGDSFVHYGLGNLFFDQMHSLGARQEFVDRHVFYDGRHISIELLTAMLEDFAQPRPMTEDERQQLLDEMYSLSGWIEP